MHKNIKSEARVCGMMLMAIYFKLEKKCMCAKTHRLIHVCVATATCLDQIPPILHLASSEQ